MLLPNGDHASVDIRKLRDYCLSIWSLRGKHKARVFAAVLGLTSEDAESLRTRLLEAARNAPAELGESDKYGQRYVVDFIMTAVAGSGMVRSIWIIPVGAETPSLITCYVLPARKAKKNDR